jgi:hypothetical protein
VIVSIHKPIIRLPVIKQWQEIVAKTTLDMNEGDLILPLRGQQKHFTFFPFNWSQYEVAPKQSGL